MPNQAQEMLNVVVVICHDLGRYVGCYGKTAVRTPQIDTFATESHRFENSFCVAPQCSPSRAAMFTGRYPHSNGVVGLTHSGFQNDLHADEQHFAQLLRRAGYETHLFGIQHESPTAERVGYQFDHGRGSCHELAEAFAGFVNGRSTSAPFFAQIGFFEPHRPYPSGNVAKLRPEQVDVPPFLPDIPAVRADLVDFEASVATADAAFGRIVTTLKQSNLWENTIVIFTADHGAPFPRAKMTLYDPGLEIPLLIKIVGKNGRVHPQTVANVDFLPTMLDLLGLPIPNNVQGKSFASLLREEEGARGRTAVFAEKTYHTYYDPMRCIRTDRWKLIANFEFAPAQETSPDYSDNARSYIEVASARNLPKSELYHPPYELFDLHNDPHEQTNLADDPAYQTIKIDLIRQLRTWMEKTADPLLNGPIPQAAYTHRMHQFRSA